MPIFIDIPSPFNGAPAVPAGFTPCLLTRSCD